MKENLPPLTKSVRVERAASLFAVASTQRSVTAELQVCPGSEKAVTDDHALYILFAWLLWLLFISVFHWHLFTYLFFHLFMITSKIQCLYLFLYIILFIYLSPRFNFFFFSCISEFSHIY